ncbi:MAG TPA: hypothetical protein VHC20_03830 [Candidatus Paceibacterota bacterium]|jgi:hypothetical protein|nr:hypothetical protein [Candidatus Paceibacterota bacterium]
MRKLWILCGAVAVVISNPAWGIGTYKYWDGSNYIYPFGCNVPSPTTFGEVVTAPVGKSHLNKFTFSLKNFDGERGSMILRGFVYAWDGTKATGDALYESKGRTIAFQDDAFHSESFNTGGVAVLSGSQYVIFASMGTTRKDYGRCTRPYNLGWGYIGEDVYTGGYFVFSYDNRRRWTEPPGWEGLGPKDLAFEADFSR